VIDPQDVDDEGSPLCERTVPDYKPDFWYDLRKNALDRQLSFVDAVDTNWEHSLQRQLPSWIMTAVYALKPDAVKVPQAVALGSLNAPLRSFLALVSCER